MGADTTNIEVRNDLNEVARTSQILSQLWTARGWPVHLEMDATLALEEILSNVIRHGCQAGQEYKIQVRLTFESEPPAYEIEVSDDAAPYNPLLRDDPDLDVPLEKRRSGGLGIFLVKRLADDLHYDYRDGRNRLVFRKRLPL